MKSNIFLRIYVPKMLQKTDVRYHLVSGDFPLHRAKAHREAPRQTPACYPLTLLFSGKAPVRENAVARLATLAYCFDTPAIVLPIYHRNTDNRPHFLQTSMDQCYNCPSSGFLPG